MKKLEKFNDDEFSNMKKFCTKHKIIDIKIIQETYNRWDDNSQEYGGIVTDISYLVMYED